MSFTSRTVGSTEKFRLQNLRNKMGAYGMYRLESTKLGYVDFSRPQS